MLSSGRQVRSVRVCTSDVYPIQSYSDPTPRRLYNGMSPCDPRLLLHAHADPQRNAFLKAFFLHMAQNPEAQKKAQSEIDSVVGNNRLPGYADRPNLPYVNALCKEVLRFHSVVPTGMSVPHQFTPGMFDCFRQVSPMWLWKTTHTTDTSSPRVPSSLLISGMY